LRFEFISRSRTSLCVILPHLPTQSLRTGPVNHHPVTHISPVWPVITPSLLCLWGSTSTARGKIAGSRQNRMPRGDAGPLSAVRFLTMRTTTFTSAQPDSPRSGTWCAHARVQGRRGQPALPAFIAPSVPQRSRPRSGDVPSRVSRSLRKQAHSKPRCRVRRHRKSITNARRSPSSRTPGLKSDVGSGNFAAEGKRKQAWKLSHFGAISGTSHLAILGTDSSTPIGNAVNPQ
jgi:hypothetical protein